MSTKTIYAKLPDIIKEVVLPQIKIKNVKNVRNQKPA